ncbi:MAG: oxygen-independent coproporphyrinogen III oxidase [SAR324 cluster bacterium]|nr:oxygen-independent coproporphyrinogen III oxidase [SAR324 cluster bacterium]
MTNPYLISEALIEKYSKSGPRYTSYPTAPIWEAVDVETQKSWFEGARNSKKPVSLYFHIPFCKERCAYCGCNTMITRTQDKVTGYVDFILKELESLKNFGLQGRTLRQMHFGGGTPTYLLNGEFTAIIEKCKELFEFERDAEIAIEVDPNSTREGQLEHLSRLGFNRISLGVQDFNPATQEAVNRIQTIEITEDHLIQAKELGFTGVNFDLIYGLPFQTLESFTKTIKQVIEMRPDRLALYNFAYLPSQIPNQKVIKEETLPDEKVKTAIFFKAIELFTEAGYEYIGMDHFALVTDELTKAQRSRTLYRNFMGYSPKSGVDLYGIGVSSIGETDDFFVQNEKELNPYMQKVNMNGITGTKGLKLSDDDKIRKWTILRLMCHFYLSFDEFQTEFGLDFKEYFAEELKSLPDMEADGLLKQFDDHIEIFNPGKLLVRNICMVFDAYLKGKKAPKVQFSKTL